MARDQGSNADLIVSGFGSLGQRQDAETAKNRKLNPVHAAALDRILRGEMTGEEAANWAHQNWDGASQPLPSPGGTPSIGAQGSQIPLPAGAQGAPPSPYGYPLPPGAQVQGPDGKPIARPAEGQSVDVPQGSTWSAPPKAQVASIGSYAQARPAPQRPTPEYTAQDLQDADVIAQMRQRMRPPGGLTFDQQKELAQVRGDETRKTEDTKALNRKDLETLRSTNRDAYMNELRDRVEKGQELDRAQKADLFHAGEEGKMDRLVAALETKLQIAEKSRVSKEDIEAIKAELGEAAITQRQYSSLTDVINDAAAARHAGQIDAKMASIAQRVANLSANAGVPNPAGAPPPVPYQRPSVPPSKKTTTQTTTPNAPIGRSSQPDGSYPGKGPYAGKMIIVKGGMAYLAVP